MEPIRVLHMIGSLNVGGSQTMIMNIYRKINRRKVQFDFIVDHPNELFFENEIKALGGKIYLMPTFNGVNTAIVIRSWVDFFEKHKEYHVLHSHVRSYASLFLPIAKRKGLFTIIHSHSTSNGNGIDSVLKRILQFPLRWQADYYFACSINAGRWLYGEKIIKTKRFKIIPNAIDSSQYQFNQKTRDEIRHELNISASAFVIGHVGRFTSVKNHSFLLDVFKNIHDQRRETILLLVGDGELKESLEQKINNLQLEQNVIMTGVREDVPSLMSAMDVFVFPSVYEGLGIVAIEAQAAGLPVIASEGIPKEAKISDLFYPISLIETIEKWASEVLSHQLKERTDMSQVIKQAGFDIAETTKWLERFYQRVQSK